MELRVVVALGGRCGSMGGMDGTTVELHGGSLDGWRVVVDPADPDPWIAIISDHGQYPGGRSLYAPDADGSWRWQADLPPEAL